jgi:uncharacterized protein (DUF983 family)
MNDNTLVSVLKKTLRFKCPNCGEGRLYHSFLKLVSCCSECHEVLDDIRADDAPAWLTILIVGHIVGSGLFLILPFFNYPDWLLIFVIIVPTLILSLVILPFSKSLFVGVLWFQKHKQNK